MNRNPFSYPISSELWWKKNICQNIGYKPFTTFFADLSVAECFGEKALKDTYKKILKHWKYDIKYITEFSMCLNHKIWQLRHIDKKMSMIYEELWKKSIDFVEKTYKDKDLEYFYEITD